MILDCCLLVDKFYGHVAAQEANIMVVLNICESRAKLKGLIIFLVLQIFLFEEFGFSILLLVILLFHFLDVTILVQLKWLTCYK